MAQVIGDRYQVEDVLGRGGMAEVRRGVDLRLNRPVAIKTLSPQLAVDPVAQQRFRREALAAARLNHPAIAAVFDTGTAADPVTGDELPYIVMELVEGQTLREVIRSGTPVAPAEALRLTHGVLEALAHSHAAGIIHRDIKPANVMLTPDGSVKVMDFGIARAATDTSTSLTQTASVIGTAAYLSPEQARGEKVDLRSDLYSTGCLLYELLTGRPPFTGDSSISVAYQQVNDPPVPPSQLVVGLPAGVDALTLRALAKDPADRYASAADMMADLDRVLAGHPLAPPAASVPQAALPTREATTLAGVLADPAATAPLAAQAALASPAPAVGPVPPFEPVPAGPPPARRAADPEDAPGRPLRRGLIAALVFVVLAVIVVLGFRYLGGTPGSAASGPSSVAGTTSSGSTADSATAKIPAGLVGSDVDAAKKKLKDAGFTNVKTKKAPAQTGVAKGEVISVDPSEGATTALDDRVTLSYARAEPAGSASSTEPPKASSSPTKTAGTSSDPPSSSKPSDSTSSEPSKSASKSPSKSPSKSASAKPTSSKSSPSG